MVSAHLTPSARLYFTAQAKQVSSRRTRLKTDEATIAEALKVMRRPVGEAAAVLHPGAELHCGL